MSISIEDLSNKAGFTTAEKGQVSWLPEPERAPREFTVISVDDHVVEPPHTFDGRLPHKLQERAPRVVEREDGSEAWVFEGQEMPNVGFNAVVGRPVSEYSFEPTRFDQMRKGAWDIRARIHDMDVNGVFASVCFPSFLPGFAGQRLQQLTNDPELALACIRAWNDWIIEEWSAHDPDRIIPLQLPYFLDPEVGAAEVRRNAERGFKAMTFSEAPHLLGLPSLHSRYWDPIMAACEETETVVCLHVGSSGTSPATAPDAPSDTIGVLFFGYAMFAAVDWLYSRIPVRFPDLKICLSEGGIGWVAGLLDRLEHVRKYDAMYGTWNDLSISPADTFRRNFWVCAIDDPSAFLQREVIGVENILLESDYPHADSTWPHTQERVRAQLAGLAPDEIERVTWRNASQLFRHPVPAAYAQDPERVVAETVTTPTPFGPVRGRTLDDTVVHFGGVPYARAERFGLTEPCSWTDELDATRPGPAAPQVVGGLDLVPGMAPETQSEDCLTAEIFTTNVDGSAPVLVWVPGGSYRIGGAGLDTYDGRTLAREGVVVIGLNYRLGALGWLALDGVPTNLGLRDLRAALEWIQAIAPSFGGDPSRVVVMGESAGSGMLAHALATSGTAGDIPVAGAILQSGAPAGTLDTEAVAWVAEQFLAAAGVSDLEGLRTLPIDALLAAQETTVAAALATVGMMPFHPWIDGDLLTGKAHTSPFPAIPLVVGTTAHEMELFRDQVPELPEEHALGFLGMKALTLGITDPDAVRAAFAAGGGDLVESVADLELHVPNEMLAHAHEARGNPVYRYRFTWEAPVKRACHALDLPFTFGTLDVSTWRAFAGAQGTNAAAADALSARMRAAWAAFAATGAPWDTTELVQLGGEDVTGPDAVSARVDLWIGAPTP